MIARLKKSKFYRSCWETYFRFYRYAFPVRGKNISISKLGNTRNLQFDVEGSNIQIEFGKESDLQNCKFYIRGNNHQIVIGEKVVIYKAEFWIEDNHCEIRINDGTTVQSAHFGVTENGSKIILGKDCMLSTDVEIRTGDSHSIIEKGTNNRINPAANVYIGNHVWIGSRSSILKGITLGDDVIIGSGSIVTQSVPDNCIAAGIPAKVIKNNISWLRERI